MSWWSANGAAPTIVSLLNRSQGVATKPNEDRYGGSLYIWTHKDPYLLTTRSASNGRTSTCLALLLEHSQYSERFSPRPHIIIVLILRFLHRLLEDSQLHSRDMMSAE